MKYFINTALLAELEDETKPVRIGRSSLSDDCVSSSVVMMNESWTADFITELLRDDDVDCIWIRRASGSYEAEYLKMDPQAVQS